jgi:hypothetical protein
MSMQRTQDDEAWETYKIFVAQTSSLTSGITRRSLKEQKNSSLPERLIKPSETNQEKIKGHS